MNSHLKIYIIMDIIKLIRVRQYFKTREQNVNKAFCKEETIKKIMI